LNFHASHQNDEPEKQSMFYRIIFNIIRGPEDSSGRDSPREKGSSPGMI